MLKYICDRCGKENATYQLYDKEHLHTADYVNCELCEECYRKIDEVVMLAIEQFMKG